MNFFKKFDKTLRDFEQFDKLTKAYNDKILKFKLAYVIYMTKVKTLIEVKLINFIPV